MGNNLLSILRSCIYISKDKLSHFEIDNFFEIYEEDILDSGIKSSLIVTKNKKKIEACILIMMAIKAYLDDSKNPNVSILDDLEKGHLVMYGNKKYKYLGCEIIEKGFLKGQRKIVLESKDGYYKVNENEAYNISKYMGRSKKLNKLGGELKSKETGKILIAKLLGTELEDLDGVLNQQIIVVFQSRKYMEEFIKSLNIEIEGEKYDFGRVFPSRYYSDLENYIDLKGNKLHVKPIFLFTSRLDVADQLIGENEECRKLILLGDSTYCNYVESTLDYLLRDDQLDKIIMHNTYESISMIDSLIERDISIYALENYTDDKLDNQDINRIVESNEINILLINIRKELIMLLTPDVDVIDKQIFLINSFKLLKLLQTICMPIREYKERRIVQNYLEKIKDITENNSAYESDYNQLKSILIKFNKLYSILYHFNPKIYILKELVNPKSIVILNDNCEIEYLRKYQIIKCKDIITISNIKEYEFYNEDLVFVSFYENKYINQFNLYNDNTIKNILYCTEAIKYNFQVRQLNMRLKCLYENNKLRGKFSCRYIELIKYNNILLESEYKNSSYEDVYSTKERVQREEKIIHEYIDENFKDYYDIDFLNKKEELLNLEFEKTNQIYQSNESYYDMKAYKKIIFDNGQYAYLSKNIKLFCIDSKGNHAVKKIESLNTNDKVVFTNKKTDEALDEMFEEVINSKVFKNKYNEDYKNVNYFKNALKNYIKRYDGDYELVSKELSYFNIEKGAVAIRHWTEYKIVGPREKEIYEVIGKITMDKKLFNDWSKIYESFEKIRTFKSKFKRIFKYTVKSEIVNNSEDEDEITTLILETFDNLYNYVDIVKVSQIIELNEDIDNVELNCLIGEKYSLQGGV
ncbi:MAG: DrmE family protein [Clostridium perfringens]|nr:DrmE family protein [Clostridium perfringens]